MQTEHAGSSLPFTDIIIIEARETIEARKTGVAIDFGLPNDYLIRERLAMAI
jgi:hypothetical protein